MKCTIHHGFIGVIPSVPAIPAAHPAAPGASTRHPGLHCRRIPSMRMTRPMEDTTGALIPGARAGVGW